MLIILWGIQGIFSFPDFFEQGIELYINPIHDKIKTCAEYFVITGKKILIKRIIRLSFLYYVYRFTFYNMLSRLLFFKNAMAADISYLYKSYSFRNKNLPWHKAVSLISDCSLKHPFDAPFYGYSFNNIKSWQPYLLCE